jgi:hypothetical protein
LYREKQRREERKAKEKERETIEEGNNCVEQ